MVVMISHDINIAAKYSDNIIMMRDGEIFAVGTPQDVITAENIKAVYGVDATVERNEATGFLNIIYHPNYQRGRLLK